MREYLTRNEVHVQRLAYDRVEHALEAGLNVVWDNTSLGASTEARLREIAASHGARFQVLFLDVEPSLAIQRDIQRPQPVGAPAIYGMYRKHLL